jgi:hypothetical protein
MANVRIAVNVQDGQTMSQYWMTEGGRVSFHNAATELLVVEPKSGEPFCENNRKTVIPKVEVAPGKTKAVRICDNFDAGQFLYTAQIGNALPEDPIVILERGFKLNQDMAVGAALGVLAGITVAYVAMRLTRGAQRVDPTMDDNGGGNHG